jgi:hypothetical protein
MLNCRLVFAGRRRQKGMRSLLAPTAPGCPDPICTVRFPNAARVNTSALFLGTAIDPTALEAADDGDGWNGRLSRRRPIHSRARPPSGVYPQLYLFFVLFFSTITRRGRATARMI